MTAALVAGVVIAVAQTAPAVQAPMLPGRGRHDARSWRPSPSRRSCWPCCSPVGGGPAPVALPPAHAHRGRPRRRGRRGPAVRVRGSDHRLCVVRRPLAAIGAGFVVGTCVRTAVIFAGVPRRLPATAAALNQSSLMVGAQIGVAAVTAIVSDAASGRLRSRSTQASGGDQANALAGFRAFVDAVGTSTMGEAIANLGDAPR
ncbi:MAG: hypothetical protein R3C32_07835 [Chloroflexota bacterium]